MFYHVVFHLNCVNEHKCSYCALMTIIRMADKENPQSGVIVKMSSSRPKLNCSLSVSVLCNTNGVQVRLLFFYFGFIE